MEIHLQKPLEALLISPDDAEREKVLSGEKKITIRKGWREYTLGKAILCCPIKPWCVEINIIDVKYTTLKDVEQEEYLADGYFSKQELLNDLKRFYPSLSLASKVTIIRWDNASGKLVDEYNQEQKSLNEAQENQK